MAIKTQERQCPDGCSYRKVGWSVHPTESLAVAQQPHHCVCAPGPRLIAWRAQVGQRSCVGDPAGGRACARGARAPRGWSVRPLRCPCGGRWWAAPPSGRAGPNPGEAQPARRRLLGSTWEPPGRSTVRCAWPAAVPTDGLLGSSWEPPGRSTVRCAWPGGGQRNCKQEAPAFLCLSMCVQPRRGPRPHSKG